MNNTGGTTPIESFTGDNLSHTCSDNGTWVTSLTYYDPTPKVGDKFWIYTQFGIVKAKVHTVQDGTVLVKIKLPERERTNGIKWVAYDKPLRPDECFSTKYEIIDDVISRLL